MDSSGPISDLHRSSTSLRRYGMQLTSANFLPRPLSALLEFSGLMRGRAYSSVSEQGVAMSTSSVRQNSDSEIAGDGGAEVSIRIFGVGEPDQERVETPLAVVSARNSTDASTSQSLSTLLPMRISSNDSSPNSATLAHSSIAEERGEAPDSDAAGHSREAASQRYDFQQLARWIEQALPFTILLLMVFIRQHLQGFFVAFWITAVLFWANDILRKQTALKHERKTDFLVALGCVLVVHIIGVYWWCSGGSLWRPLIFIPPRDIPPFWDAIFIIVINDTVARQAAMTFKCGVLIYYKNSRGRNYRHQAQLLTLVEYVLLLYRALIPGPVWYRFFLNKIYGNLFSSLTTGLYLTFKLTSNLEKVQTFLAARRALSRREVQYGSYATCEDVIAAGDMCAICQEKMHAPILLRCKHIFCEDCVSEWFERERTCPLCRAVVKPAGLRSFGDGSTSLFIQLF